MTDPKEWFRKAAQNNGVPSDLMERMLKKIETSAKQADYQKYIDPQGSLEGVTGKRIGIVQLGHLGDLMILLPGLKWLAEQGNEVTLITQWQYGIRFNRCPWLKMEFYTKKADDDWYGAVDLAESLGFDIIRLSQVGYVPTMLRTPSWDTEIWTRAGMPLKLFGKLPLEIDHWNPPLANYHKGQDERFLRRYWKPQPTLKPLLLVSLEGTSHKCQNRWEEFRFYGDDMPFQVVDLSKIKVAHMAELLPLFRAAKGLVSADTMPLHLGRATRTPTVALLQTCRGCASTPHDHWFWWGKMDCYTGVGQWDRIRAAVYHMMQWEKRMKTLPIVLPEREEFAAIVAARHKPIPNPQAPQPGCGGCRRKVTQK